MDQGAVFAYPTFTRREWLADAVVHVVGVAAGLAGVVWLIAGRAPDGTGVPTAALVAYCGGLLGMLSASALYNLLPVGRGKAVLRRVDHAMIFLMIAGSYTPFVMHYARLGGDGAALCATVWLAAGVGALLKLVFHRHLERIGLVLYLGLGWAIVGMGDDLWASLSSPVQALLVAGGVAYSVGAVIQLWAWMRYHNVCWHLLVLVGAGCHYAAITTLASG